MPLSLSASMFLFILIFNGDTSTRYFFLPDYVNSSKQSRVNCCEEAETGLLLLWWCPLNCKNNSCRLDNLPVPIVKPCFNPVNSHQTVALTQHLLIENTPAWRLKLVECQKRSFQSFDYTLLKARKFNYIVSLSVLVIISSVVPSFIHMVAMIVCN